MFLKVKEEDVPVWFVIKTWKENNFKNLKVYF